MHVISCWKLFIIFTFQLTKPKLPYQDLLISTSVPTLYILSLSPLSDGCILEFDNIYWHKLIVLTTDINMYINITSQKYRSSFTMVCAKEVFEGENY
jgi:hypothetical protein